MDRRYLSRWKLLDGECFSLKRQPMAPKIVSIYRGVLTIVTGVWEQLGFGGYLQVEIVKLSSWRIPRQFIELWLKALVKELKKSASHDISKKELTLVFVNKAKIKSLNKDFRSKPKVTDILSFYGFTNEELGELIICGERIDQQALDHQLSKREELGYLLIHGVLHLLGYEHEKGGQDEKVMFELQDQLFEVLRKRLL